LPRMSSIFESHCVDHEAASVIIVLLILNLLSRKPPNLQQLFWPNASVIVHRIEIGEIPVQVSDEFRLLVTSIFFLINTNIVYKEIVITRKYCNLYNFKQFKSFTLSNFTNANSIFNSPTSRIL